MFDIDGTLYDYEYCNKIAERELYAAVQREFDIEEECIKELLKSAKKKTKEQLGNVAASHNRLLYMQKICEMAGRSPLLYAKAFYDVYWDTFLEAMKLYEYVLPLFRELKERDIKIGLLTDLTAHIQYRKMEKLGLADYIDYLTTSEEVGAEKPDKAMFGNILSKAGCTPDETLMIGDSLERDIHGAQENGMKAIRYQEGLDIYKKVIGIL